MLELAVSKCFDMVSTTHEVSGCWGRQYRKVCMAVASAKVLAQKSGVSRFNSWFPVHFTGLSIPTSYERKTEKPHYGSKKIILSCSPTSLKTLRNSYIRFLTIHDVFDVLVSQCWVISRKKEKYHIIAMSTLSA